MKVDWNCLRVFTQFKFDLTNELEDVILSYALICPVFLGNGPVNCIYSCYCSEFIMTEKFEIYYRDSKFDGKRLLLSVVIILFCVVF